MAMQVQYGNLTAFATVELPLSEANLLRYQNRMELKQILTRMDERISAISANGKPMSDRAVSLAAGLSGDAIRNWRRAAAEGKSSGAHADSIRKIAVYLGVTETWLIHGRENPRSEEVAELLNSLELLDEDGRRQLRKYASFLVSEQSPKPE